MTTETLNLIHRSYQEALVRSNNILEIVENLYEILSDEEVVKEDSKSFDSFIDGLRACIQYRRKTFTITNMTTYINITFMYIVLWLNSTQGMQIDIDWYSRRKALESDLTKILKKSYLNQNVSANIRDRFGLRGILLNNISSEEAIKYIYKIFDAIQGIVAAKDRKLRKSFIDWYKNNANIPTIDKTILNEVLSIPFSVDYVKDFIANPKSNTYQSLQFTMSIQMYSNILAGCQLEVQLRSKEMHENAENGPASHTAYKNEEDADPVRQKVLEEIRKVFVVDDFSVLHITGFTSYSNKEDDRDGIHFSKEFSDRRISTTLVSS